MLRYKKASGQMYEIELGLSSYRNIQKHRKYIAIFSIPKQSPDHIFKNAHVVHKQIVIINYFFYGL